MYYSSIQDSIPDWETEATRMADIYLNSLLTLAATASVDGSRGCLFPRLPITVGSGNIETGFSTGEMVPPRTAIPEGTDIFVRKPVKYSHDIIHMANGGAKKGARTIHRAGSPHIRYYTTCIRQRSRQKTHL